MKPLSSGLVTLVLSTVLGGPPSGEPWQQELDLGRSLVNQGSYAAARDAFERARQQAERFGAGDARLAVVLNDLGTVYAHLADINRAERCYRRAAQIWQARGDAVGALAPMANLAGLRLIRRQYRSAEAALQDALDLATRRLGPDHPQTAVIVLYLAYSAGVRGDYKTASAYGERALQSVRKSYGPASPATAGVADALGTIYRAQGRVNEASGLFIEAVAILKKSGQQDHPAWIRALEDYSSVLIDRRLYAEADALLLRSLGMAEAMLGPNHPEVARILRERALVARKSGHKSEARHLEARAAKIQKQSDMENGIGSTIEIGSLFGFRAVEGKRRAVTNSDPGSMLDFQDPAAFHQGPSLRAR